MREKFKPNTDERREMIVFGIIAVLLLVVGFIAYLYFLHRVSLFAAGFSVVIFLIIYMPRIFIIKKLLKKDDIKIFDNSISINGRIINLKEIIDYKAEEKKPVVVFVFNNNLITYQEAKFLLKTTDSVIPFTAIGSEKISLLKEFLDMVIS